MELFWWFRLAALNEFCGTLLMILLFATVVTTFFYSIDDRSNTELPKKTYKKIKILVFMCVLFSTLWVLTPSKSEIAIMFGWDGLKSESVKEVVELLKDKIQ